MDWSVLQAAQQKHYVPLGYVLRNHWHGLILQACYEACECRVAVAAAGLAAAVIRMV
jgi:hypothetical protein